MSTVNITNNILPTDLKLLNSSKKTKGCILWFTRPQSHEGKVNVTRPLNVIDLFIDIFIYSLKIKVNE